MSRRKLCEQKILRETLRFIFFRICVCAKNFSAGLWKLDSTCLEEPFGLNFLSQTCPFSVWIGESRRKMSEGMVFFRKLFRRRIIKISKMISHSCSVYFWKAGWTSIVHEMSAKMRFGVVPKSEVWTVTQNWLVLTRILWCQQQQKY